MSDELDPLLELYSVEQEWNQAAKALEFRRARHASRADDEAARDGGAFYWSDLDATAVDPLTHRAAVALADLYAMAAGIDHAPQVSWFTGESAAERRYADANDGDRPWLTFTSQHPLTVIVDPTTRTIRLHADLAARCHEHVIAAAVDHVAAHQTTNPQPQESQ